MLPPSEFDFFAAAGGVISGELRELDDLADEFMERAAATDPDAFARIAARHPIRPLRSLKRPRMVRANGAQREVHDLDIASVSVERQLYRIWLEDTWA